MSKKFFRVLRRQDTANSTLMNVIMREGKSTDQAVPPYTVYTFGVFCWRIKRFIRNRCTMHLGTLGASPAPLSSQLYYITNDQKKQGFGQRRELGLEKGEGEGSIVFNLKKRKRKTTSQFSCPAHRHTSGSQHPRPPWACCTQPLLFEIQEYCFLLSI